MLGPMGLPLHSMLCTKFCLLLCLCGRFCVSYEMSDPGMLLCSTSWLPKWFKKRVKLLLQHFELFLSKPESVTFPGTTERRFWMLAPIRNGAHDLLFHLIQIALDSSAQFAGRCRAQEIGGDAHLSGHSPVIFFNETAAFAFLNQPEKAKLFQFAYMVVHFGGRFAKDLAQLRHRHRPLHQLFQDA